MKSMRTRLLASSLVASLVSIASTASAQCGEWSPRFPLRGPNSFVRAMTEFDDGSGPALYVGGHFSAVGNVNAHRIARWDGIDWSPLGTGMQGFVYALAVHDDGSGAALYAGGSFTLAGGTAASNVARWNGTAWSALGVGVVGAVNALASYDDGLGGGPALYVAGSITSAGGSPASRIAKWNGSSWSTLGLGVNNAVSALAVHDDGLGGGAALYVGGAFTIAGGASANRIARWNGSTWSTLATGVNGAVNALVVHQPMSGNAELYLGGTFSMADGSPASRIAGWNGVSYFALGGLGSSVQSLTSFDDGLGGGAAVYAGSATSFSVRRWNGTSWSTLGSGSGGLVYALFGFDDGSGAGSALWSGGNFSAINSDGRRSDNLARWIGSGWAPLTLGLGVSGAVRALMVFDDPVQGEERLVAGGAFGAVGGDAAANVASWNGAQWSPLGSGVGPGGVNALAVYDDGSGGGAALFAGGHLSNIDSRSDLKRWDGSQWLDDTYVEWTDADPDGVEAEIFALQVFDDGTGPALFAGGIFDRAGTSLAAHIAKWNGVSWTAIPGPDVFGGWMLALTVFDDGSGGGPALYAGGHFNTIGSLGLDSVGKWNGTSWSALSGGVDRFGNAGDVNALCVFDDGSGGGPALFATGAFDMAGGMSAANIAKWNGTAWSTLGTGLNGTGYALSVVDAGDGPALYVGGEFTTAGGVSASRIAKWKGGTWSALAQGVNSNVLAIAGYEDNPGDLTSVYVGGFFTQAGSQPSNGIAEWFGCKHEGNAYCFGDGLDPVVTAECPCANFGDAGHGCANSAFPSGAILSATGTTSPNTILFTMTDVPNNTLATGFRNSTINPGGAVFGDGVRCQTGALLRFGTHNTGAFGDAPNTWTAGVETVPPGQTRYYLVQYRNGVPGFCPPETFNISNGYSLTW